MASYDNLFPGEGGENNDDDYIDPASCGTRTCMAQQHSTSAVATFDYWWDRRVSEGKLVYHGDFNFVHRGYKTVEFLMPIGVAPTEEDIRGQLGSAHGQAVFGFNMNKTYGEFMLMGASDWHFSTVNTSCGGEYEYEYRLFITDRYPTETRWKATVHAYYRISTYVYCKCVEPDVEFPSCVDGFNYEGYLECGGISNFDENLNILQDFCNSHYGKLEVGYYNCVYYYRCKWREGYKYNPSTNSFDPDYCIYVEKIDEYIHESDDEYNGRDDIIYPKRAWIYRATIQTITGEPGALEEDIGVYLSYTGSTVINGIDFNAPSSVTISSGQASVNFQVLIFENIDFDNKLLYITGTTIEHDSCNTLSNLILYLNENEITPEPINPDDYTSCCDWVPKNFIGWSYGDYMKRLVPPNMR